MKRIIMLLLVVVVLINLCGCLGNNYKNAVKLYEEGNYEDAKVLFEKLGDYEDSSSFLVKCETAIQYKKALSLYESGEYEQAKEIFVSLGSYEDSETYVKTINMILNPVSAIEAACKQRIDDDPTFWKSYNDFLDIAKSIGLASSGGKLVFETKYDEKTREFACLVDIPFMQGNSVYSHYYFGFAGHVDKTNVAIDKIDSIEFSEKGATLFWSKYWKH